MSFEEWCEEFASHLGDRDDAKWMKEDIFAQATWVMLNKKIDKLEKQLEETESALKFYGNENYYFLKERNIDMNQTTAIFKQDYAEGTELSQPNIKTIKVYDCSAKIKTDQGKRAREYFKNKGEK
ncbi:hypothetical protein [Kangiella sp.]|uniref:hypothetical protein n=1 Tax=Kangiella sp. TaxID=1920245 RepID=UPI003A95A976